VILSERENVQMKNEWKKGLNEKQMKAREEEYEREKI
jgi:hypothetical protein